MRTSVRKGTYAVISSRRIVLIAALVSSLAPAVFASQPLVEHYRWRNDNGSESTATWKANQDTVLTDAPHYTNIRLRVAISYNVNQSSYPSCTVPLTLEYSTGTPPSYVWSPVPASDDLLTPLILTPTPNYAHGDKTTALLPGTGAWLANGICMETPNTNASVVVNEDTYVNVEFCLQATDRAYANQVYYLRVVSPTSQKDGSLYPQIRFGPNVTGSPPDVSSPTSASGSEGSPFSYTIASRGAVPITFSASGLPAGLSLSGDTISGFPLMPGVFDATILATNAFGSDSHPLRITISGAPTEIVVDNIDSAKTEYDTSYSPSSTSGSWGGNSCFGFQSTTDESKFTVFRWYPDVGKTAPYDVYAWWTYHPRRTKEAVYRLVSQGTTNTVTVNQRDASQAGKWVWLGRKTFVMGERGYVSLSAENGQVSIDAVKWVRSTGFTDTDSDGMDDSWEVANFGSINAPNGAATADPDGDGMNNLSEYLAGTVPTNALSLLTVGGGSCTADGNQFVLTWSSVAGKRYSVQRTPSLLTNIWHIAAPDVLATPPLNVYTDTVVEANMFYRVMVQP